MAFPCNQFGGQEPGTNSEITAFAEARGFVGPQALLMDKVDVNGPQASPVWDFLKIASGDNSLITWNFAKFLVAKDGRVVGRYGTMVDPSALQPKIEELLQEQAPQ